MAPALLKSTFQLAAFITLWSS